MEIFPKAAKSPRSAAFLSVGSVSAETPSGELPIFGTLSLAAEIPLPGKWRRVSERAQLPDRDVLNLVDRHGAPLEKEPAI